MKDKLERVREWFHKARNDMKIALREMQWEDAATDAVCFHFQQAAEKMLKAWLIWRDIDFPPTHNIEVLLAACERDDSSFSELRSIESLTPYAVQVRYADDFYLPTAEEARQTAEMARVAESFILEKFEALGVKIAESR